MDLIDNHQPKKERLEPCPGTLYLVCLLYTSDAADDTPCVDLGGRRIIKKNRIDSASS